MALLLSDERRKAVGRAHGWLDLSAPVDLARSVRISRRVRARPDEGSDYELQIPV